MIFLDHNSTTPVLPQAMKKMLPYYNEKFFNPGGVQKICTDIKLEIEEARSSLSKLISQREGQIIFTASATEANNLILSQKFFDFVITSAVEHPSVVTPAFAYHKDSVYLLPLLPDGQINIVALREKLVTCSEKKLKILISVQHANQVIHTIQPINKIRKLCKEFGATFHIDATQTFGKIPMNEIDADFITVSSHKCYGPKGIAALWIADNSPLYGNFIPLIYGGHQENGLRAGTQNVPGIIGFVTAAEYMNNFLSKHKNHVNNLATIFYKKLKETFPDITLNGNETLRLPGGLHFSVPGVDSRAVILTIPNLIISTGMSCSSAESDPVLKALGKQKLMRSSFRVQIGFENTQEEIFTACDSLINSISKSLKFWGKI